MFSHKDSSWALWALLFELLYFTVCFNGEVLKKSLCSLLVSVFDLLGSCVNFLFTFTLTTFGVNKGVNNAFINKASFNKMALVLKLGSTEDNTVDLILADGFNLRSIKRKLADPVCFGKSINKVSASSRKLVR